MRTPRWTMPIASAVLASALTMLSLAPQQYGAVQTRALTLVDANGRPLAHLRAVPSPSGSDGSHAELVFVRPDGTKGTTVNPFGVSATVHSITSAEGTTVGELGCGGKAERTFFYLRSPNGETEAALYLGPGDRVRSQMPNLQRNK